MLNLMIETLLQAYPMYLLSLPCILIGGIAYNIRIKNSGIRVGLWGIAYAIIWVNILIILAATIYSEGVLTRFEIVQLTNVNNIHFDVNSFFNNILLNSLAGSFHSTVNWLGNILLFVPLGFCEMWLTEGLNYRKTKITISTAVFSILIEAFQICTGRIGDGIDIILNTTGAFIGVWLFVYVVALLNCKKSK